MKQYLHKLDTYDEQGRYVSTNFYLDTKPMREYELESASTTFSIVYARDFFKNMKPLDLGFDCSDTEFDYYQLKNGLLEDVLERYRERILTEKENKALIGVSTINEVQANFDLFGWLDRE